jgi:gamma-glutamyltranspeptidase / glutathione hydrolase
MLAGFDHKAKGTLMPWPNRGIAHRPAVTGANAAVSSAHPLASLAGLEMQRLGGNAVDSAVAMAAALNVVEPYMSGAAGIGYMVIHDGNGDKPIILNYNGRAPAAASVAEFPDEDTKNDGIRSPLVPGAAAGWLMAIERFGALDPKTVLAPAIRYAEEGFPVTINNQWFMESNAARLAQWPTSVDAYFVNGRTPRAGEILRQPNLAKTLRTLAEEGIDAFYEGPIAEEIVRFSQENGGLFSLKDFSSYRPHWEDPISGSYRGYTIFCPGPPGSALEYVQTLGVVDGFDMAGFGHNSAAYIHHLAEAMKLSVADRTTYAPRHDAPVEHLTSPGYLSERRGLIDRDWAAWSGGERFTPSKQPGEVLAGNVERIMKESTTHFVAADASGMTVSCTQTLGGGFGSGVVHGDTGLALNNFCNWFDLDPESPNVIAPNKTVEQCLSPSQVWRDGKPFLVVGTPGSFGIMQTTPQMIMNVLDHGFSIQAAIEAPRFRTGFGRELWIERRIDDNVVQDLRRLGHEVQLLDSWTPFVGGGQGLMRDPDSGAFLAGADPRRDGYALAL